MSKLSVFLSKKNKRVSIPLNPEHPFLKVLRIRILDINEANSEEKYQMLRGINIHAIFYYDGGQYNSNVFIGNKGVLNISSEVGVVEINEVLTKHDVLGGGNFIELYYEPIDAENLDIEVVCDCFDWNVPLNTPFEKFKVDLARKDNVKILFSAPFGQGKTTFLNHFFDENKNEYEVFKVFPVNYSISHNEDVFKYIKCEILFQLLGKDIEFDKVDFTYLDTLPEFIKEDPFKILSPFSKMLPKTARSIFEISESVYKLAKEIEKHKSALEINDEKAAEVFIKELYEKEGSVFEDNFYTQLIRQLLKRLKEKNSAKNVLIIEDLDRMDPDHIFRILNVFAAHFDDSDKYNGFTNKFGFDKIIVVADYNNIKSIFEYRYGPNVRFDGYINKFYSRDPFYYDNNKAIAAITNRIVEKFPQGSLSSGLSFFLCILEDLIATENITLRDLLRLLKYDSVKIIVGQLQKTNIRGKEFYDSIIPFNLIYYLTILFDSDTLIKKIQICQNRETPNPKWRYHQLAALTLPALVVDSSMENKNLSYKFQGKTLDFVVTMSYDNHEGHGFYKADIIKNNAVPSENIAFSKHDFYELLLLSIKQYNKVGGFN